ncbi:MAG: hypothetical protein WD048_05070 [Chitinophagales bacterium]
MKKSAFALIGIISVSSLGFLAFKSSDSDKASYQVEYKVECDKCTVSYRNKDGESEVVKNAENWNLKFNAPKGNFVYVSATNTKGKQVKVTILKDGKLEVSDESVKEFVSARVGTIL